MTLFYVRALSQPIKVCHGSKMTHKGVPVLIDEHAYENKLYT